MPIRVLQVLPGPVPPPKDPTYSEMYHLGGDISGDVLQPTWAKSAEELREKIGSFPTYQINNFTFHLHLANYPIGTLRYKLDAFRFHLKTGLRLGRERHYDCVKSYGAGLTGLTAAILARLLRTKLIVELPNNPEDAYKFSKFISAYEYSSKPDFRTRLAKMTANPLLALIVLSAARVQLLYPKQLRAYPRLQKVPVSVVPTFTPVSKVPASSGEDGSVLLVGGPWYVKGVDVLIRAWRKIEADFPDNKLKLMGAYLEEDLIRQMIGDSRQIEILKPRPNPETLQVIARCSIFVLASRTEGVPRVFIEAMAAGKPVVGSRVAGVPYIIRNGVNGFVFESEDADELAEELRVLLEWPELRARMGERSLRFARTQLDENSWSRRMQEMFEVTVYGKSIEPTHRKVEEAAPARP
jgi:glycosyltransferase involved in cell wall biosynthesis